MIFALDDRTFTQVKRYILTYYAPILTENEKLTLKASINEDSTRSDALK